VPQGGELALPYQWQYRLDRWKAALQGFFGGGNQQPRPKLCPNCGSLVGISATRCHNCGTNLKFSMAAVNRSLSGVFSGPAPVTTVLLVANLLMFGVEWMAAAAQGQGGGLSILGGMGGEAAYRLGMSSPYAIYIQHQWYRLITAMFLHGGLIHIGFNMMALMQLGPALEELYGSSRYFFLYIFTGAFGFLISSFPYGPWYANNSLGASGGLLGLVGAMLAITTKRGGAYMRELRSRLISSVVFLFVLGFMGMGIDNKAHLAGLASGFALGKIFADRQPMNVREKQIAIALGWLAAIAVIASFAFMILHYRDPLPGQA
jgi:rhomboid protease GluP